MKFAFAKDQHVQTGRFRCKTRVGLVCRTDEKARYGVSGGGRAQTHKQLTSTRDQAATPPLTLALVENDRLEGVEEAGGGIRVPGLDF